MQWEGLIGEAYGFVASELKSRLLDAFSVDVRITGINDFTYSVDKDVMTVSLTVNTVYGNIKKEMEVRLT